MYLARNLVAATAAALTLLVSLSASADRGQPVPELLELHNQARASARTCGDQRAPAVAPLRWSDDLAEAARVHAVDIAANQIRGHTGSDGSSVRDRVERINPGYSWIGENVSYFNATAELANQRWLESAGHCENIMRQEYSYMGAAMIMGPRFNAPDQMAPYWVVVFANRSGQGTSNEPQRDEADGDPFALSEADLEYLRSQEILLYGRDTCGLTRGARTLLEEKGIPYRYYNVDNDARANQEMWTKIRATGHEGSVRFPIVDVGGRVSISNVRTARILEAVRAQPAAGSTGGTTPGRSPRGSNEDDMGFVFALGAGVGAIFADDVQSADLLRHHRLHFQGQGGFRMGDPSRRILQIEPSVFFNAGAENRPGISGSGAYSPYWHLEAGLIWQHFLRVSAGGGGVISDTPRDLSSFLSGTVAIVLRQSGMQYEVALSRLMGLPNSTRHWMVGMSASFRL